jgi:hypothetical protein
MKLLASVIISTRNRANTLDLCLIKPYVVRYESLTDLFLAWL